MAKKKFPKPRPSKPAKQHHKRNGGEQNDVSGLRAQLDVLDLKIIQVTADGNCLFRALADQLEGDEDQHEKYRHSIVRFIKKNREMFEPFVEDEPFDEYCQSMLEDGTWAGNIELQAASLATEFNICIHRHMSPRWYILNFDEHKDRTIHLSYHDGEHYNSVRAKDDACTGPARPIIIKGESDLQVKPNHRKPASVKYEVERGEDIVSEECIDFMKGENEQVLQQPNGDIDGQDEISHSIRSSSGENSDSEHAGLRDQGNICRVDARLKDDKKSSSPDEKLQKNVSRNKSCPCGSKKKYKSCCGTVNAKASARFSVTQRKHDRKQCRKNQSDGAPLDMGALCI